jgi:SAM-dependent methyltransferase
MMVGAPRKSLLVPVLVLIAAVAHAQAAQPSPYHWAPPSPDGTGKFYLHREIAQVMGFQGAGWLERPERQTEERPDKLLAALSLRAGMNIADIGAGSGYLSRRMAPLIAPGKVYAVDVQPEMVQMLKELSRRPETANLVPVLGSPDNINLQSDSIDLAILVDTYHELSQPYEIMQSVISSLKAGGRVVFVEYRGEDPRVPIKSLHKMTVSQLRLEMRRFPLTFERTDEGLPIQHIVVFRKK